MAVKVRVFRYETRSEMPSPPQAGIYFIADVQQLLVARSDGAVEEYGGGGDGSLPAGGALGQALAKLSGDDFDAGWVTLVLDGVAGDDAERAPSQRAVKAALAGKADLVNGKVPAGQLPNEVTLNRGIFDTAADLAAACPTDEEGAYATVLETSSTWYYGKSGWADSGVTGVYVESVNGKMGPEVSLGAADVGAAPAGHGHAVEDVEALQAALDEKAGLNHTQAISTVAGLQEALDGKAAAGHTQAISTVTGLQAALDGLTQEVATREKSADKGVANGYAALDASGKLAGASVPATVELVARKGAASGYAPLAANAKVPIANLPVATDAEAAAGVSETALVNAKQLKANGGGDAETLRKELYVSLWVPAAMGFSGRDLCESERLGMLFGASGDTYVRSSANGLNWTYRSTGNTGSTMAVLDSARLGKVFVAGGSGHISESVDTVTWTGGAIANLAVSDCIYSLCDSTRTGTLVAVGSGGNLYTSATGASGSWTKRASGTTAILNKVIESKLLGMLIAVGAGGTILVSTDGTAWSQRSIGDTSAFNDVFEVLPWKRIFAVGATCSIYSTTDGNTWTKVALPFSLKTDLTCMTYFEDLGMLMAGGGRYVYTTTDGEHWVPRVAVEATSGVIYSLLSSRIYHKVFVGSNSSGCHTLSTQ